MARDGKPSAEDITEASKKDDRFEKMKAGSALDSDEEEEGEGDGETDHYDHAFKAIQDGDAEAFKEHMKKAHGK